MSKYGYKMIWLITAIQYPMNTLVQASIMLCVLVCIRLHNYLANYLYQRDHHLSLLLLFYFYLPLILSLGNDLIVFPEQKH